jgi:hypothetical protein
MRQYPAPTVLHVSEHPQDGAAPVEDHAGRVGDLGRVLRLGRRSSSTVIADRATSLSISMWQFEQASRMLDARSRSEAGGGRRHGASLRSAFGRRCGCPLQGASPPRSESPASGPSCTACTGDRPAPRACDAPIRSLPRRSCPSPRPRHQAPDIQREHIYQQARPRSDDSRADSAGSIPVTRSDLGCARDMPGVPLVDLG